MKRRYIKSAVPKGVRNGLLDSRVLFTAPIVPFREPCFACQVPYDRHDEHGCKRWRQR